ncbi:MAG: BspA family leucine-rich repeat surface protein [Bacillota bacterium]
MKSQDSVGNSTACTSSSVSYTYLACTASQKNIEGTCADPIVVTLGLTTNDPGIRMTAASSMTVDVESNTGGVVTTATQGGATDVLLTLYPTGNAGVIVSFWPSKLNLDTLKFCSNGSLSTTKSIQKLNSIGSYKIASASLMFAYCKELTEITNVVGLSSALSTATDMSSMFIGTTSFNQSLAGLDTSNVTNMNSMFYGATSYNQPLPSSFDTSKVTDMSWMFTNASAYNQLLPSSFNTSNVTNMSYMFYGATSYNQPLPLSFDTLKVTDMSSMFDHAYAYNQTWPSNFNTSNVTSMNSMFSSASSYNQPLPISFDTSNVTDMRNMFASATLYNQPLPASFNTLSVTDMSYMFYGASAYNQPLPSNFNTSNVKKMRYMFASSGFNQALPASFDTSQVTNMDSMFSNATTFNQNMRSALNVCMVTTYSNFATSSPIDSTSNVPVFGDLSQCNKGGPQ